MIWGLLYQCSYLWYFSVNKYRSKVFVLFPILFFWIMIFSLRRESYGEDIKYYYYIFLHPERYYLDEYGLYYFNIALRWVTTEYFWFSLSYSVLINSLLVILYRILDRKLSMLLFLYVCSTFIYYQINLNIFRQGVAVLLVLISIAIFHKHFFYSCMILLLAIFFHKAAIISVVFIFFSRFQFKKIYILPVLVLSFFPIGATFYSHIAVIIGKFIPIMERTLTAYVEMAQQGLISSSELNHRNLPMLITSLLFFKIDIQKNKKNNSLFWVYFLSLGISALLSNNVLLYDRVIIFSQILQPYLFLICCKAYFSHRWLLPYIMTAVLQFIFTIYIWGPQNLLPSFEFYQLF
ncbi:EpsG family protein [Colwellia sp. MB02u-6]|uniref:EpsG family protein n=1 Tax=Colwellia sp. MB02u-6 TaxID=2759824 RepID=UPI00217556CB|nr:EpsG family protein [Colwellia sp. MB02u-6]